MAKRLFKICGITFFSLIAVIVTAHVVLRPQMKPLSMGTIATRIVVEKSKHQLTLYDADKVLRIYQVSFGRGGLAAKQREGDRLTPEGQYTISGRNARSRYHLSLRISYPDPKDIKRAAEQGVSAGSDIMLHGLHNGLGWLGVAQRQLDWTQGCIALTNPEIEELWRVVPDGTVIEIKA